MTASTNFESKVVLLTGASSGIGQATAAGLQVKGTVSSSSTRY